MLESFMAFVERANELLWGPAALVFLGAIGIYLTIGTKGAHLRRHRQIFDMTIGKFGKDDEDDGLREFSVPPNQCLHPWLQ